MEVAGKTALVTGGAHRIGRSISLALAEAGANVVVNYHSSADAAQATVRDIEALGVGALPARADVGDYEQVQVMVDAAVDRFGTIDVLVNNAASFLSEPFPAKDLAVWHRSIDTLVHGPFYCANVIAPHMLEQGRGVIIGIGDLTCFEPWPGFAAHGVGKGAVLSLTRSLALELAPTVRANAIVLGPILRPDGVDDATYNAIAGNTLLHRWGTPDEVADVVTFLIEADYITGEIITLDGGQRLSPRTYEHG